MKRSIFGPIVFGILFGAAAFFAPFFLLKAVFFLMIIGFIFRMFWWRRQAWYYGQHYRMAYIDKVRKMSDEEYSEFKNKFSDCRGYHYRGCYDSERYSCDTHNYCGDSKSDKKEDGTENKTNKNQ
jgi:hypothetical protein